MIGSSHSQLWEKNSCSVELRGGPLDHNPRKIPVEDGRIVISQNKSKCLLLNDKQMPQEILFSLLDKKQNTKKTNPKKENLKKMREIGWVVLIYL